MTVLANEPLGSFMVRRSETQPGALALSVRVPKTFHPLGITHYIILRVEGGHQIKVRHGADGSVNIGQFVIGIMKARIKLSCSQFTVS